MLTESEAVMPAINAHLAADLTVEGEVLPVYVWTIDHPAGRVLVDNMSSTTARRRCYPDSVCCRRPVIQRRVLALAAPTWLTHADGGPRVPRPN